MKSNHAMCAKKIREELKAVFPDIKFSVKSESYSMGSAVRIDWENGPSTEQVDKYIKHYQYGHFDGMTDMYEYSNRKDDIPQVQYVTTHRKITDNIVSIFKDFMKQYYNGFENVTDKLDESFTDNHGEYSNWHQIAWRELNKTDLTNVKSFEHDNSEDRKTWFLPVLEVQ